MPVYALYILRDNFCISVNVTTYQWEGNLLVLSSAVKDTDQINLLES